MRGLFIIAAMLGAVGFPTALAADGGKVIEACNYAPYEVKVSLLSSEEQEEAVVRSKKVATGKCGHFSVDMAGNARHFVYHQAVSGIGLARLQLQDFFREYWEGETPNSGLFAGDEFGCVDADGSVLKLAPDGECGKFGRLVYLREMSVFDAKGVSHFLIHDEAVCGKTRVFDCNRASVLELAEWAKALAVSLAAGYLEAHRNIPWGRVVYPISIGLSLKDVNGPYDLGVEITQALEVTPLGSPVTFKAGDVIVSMNGQPVFDGNDLVRYIVLHGMREGVEKPYKLIVSRDNGLWSLEGYLFFDNGGPASKIFLDSAGNCKFVGVATLTSALDEFVFYTAKTVICSLKNSDREARSCVFEKTQFMAALAQYCPDEKWIGQFVGGLYMPGRQLAERTLLKSGVFAGRQGVSAVLRTMLLEGGEEALRASVSVPIGYSADDKLSYIKQSAGLGAGIGGALQFAITGRRWKR